MPLARSPLALLLAAALASAGPRVSVTLDPPEGDCRPGETMVTFRIAATDDAGAPIPDARIAYRLDTPPKNLVVSTDFPIVEETTLQIAERTAPDGVVQFEQVLPIRGVYSLSVEAKTPKGDATLSHSFRIPEREWKVRNALTLVGALFLLGLVAGWFFARSRRPTEGLR